MAPATKSSKQATKGVKQISEENDLTLNFYRNMIIGAHGTYLLIMSIFYELTSVEILLSVISIIINIGCYSFMSYTTQTKLAPSGQISYSGIDLNIEGGIGEHLKDLIILASGIQLLLILSNYCSLLWTLVPLRLLWVLWVNVVSPWIFAEPPVVTEKSKNKQRKFERKLARSVYRSY
ncbi:PREDICTED: transmembrane protein 208 [Ceratosolen solmsi marchali]|uniref:Transmembrane protein 208 n=1 Tax=Ceratosolen solmsi marchali TaxID=326594 RepID=A0AAJ6VN12_9HYME|nr:PREDICTED: transmembrane protein 208 [Ceratosolen solmsi marchali]